MIVSEKQKKAIRAAKKEVAREYRARNKETLNAYRREWAQNNPDKIREYQARYWINKAKELGVN